MNNISLEDLAALAGAVGVIGSFLATVMPKHWPATKLLAQLFLDARGVRQPNEQPHQPDEAK